MDFRIFGVVMGTVGLLAACAPQTAPERVNPEPVFDKYGNGSCEEGYIYVPGTAPIAECIPEDECDPVYAADGSVIACPPPERRPDPGDDDDSSTTGRTPSGGDDSSSSGRSPTGSAPGTGRTAGG